MLDATMGLKEMARKIYKAEMKKTAYSIDELTAFRDALLKADPGALIRPTPGGFFIDSNLDLSAFTSALGALGYTVSQQ